MAETKPPIPDYDLLRIIGRGAYGEVWLARNLTDSLVAIKVVHRATFEHERPFEREFQGLKHFEPISRSDPSEVAILHVGRGEGFFYYVMELADDRNAGLDASNPNGGSCGKRVNASGTPLGYAPKTLKSLLLDRGSLPPSECLPIAQSLVQALAHLHRHGLVHRDIKPSNVIFVQGVAKLADIGLVASIDATRSLVGTEGYLPPEGAGTPQADIFSLGKVLYEMSTGCRRSEFPALPSDVATRSDRDALLELNAIVTRACQFNPGARYSSAQPIAQDLDLIQAGRSVKGRRRRQQYWASFRKIGLGLIGLAGVTLGVAYLVPSLSSTKLSSDGPRSPNLEANAICEQALHLLRGDSYTDFPRVYTNFHRAIGLDSHFVGPYVGLLELLLRDYNPDFNDRAGELRRVAHSLEELAPELAPAHCAQSIIAYFDWRYPEAKQQVEAAIKANKDYELGHTWYGFILMMWGQPVPARAELGRALSIAASKVTIYRCVAQTYYVERNYRQATEWYQKALEREPHHQAAHYFMWRAFWAQADYSNAFTHLELSGEFSKEDVKDLRCAFEEGGPHRYWEERWKELERGPQGKFYIYDKAVVQIQLGNTERAFDFLTQSYETERRDPARTESSMMMLLFDEYWDPVREHPTFKDLLGKVGYARVTPSLEK